MAKASHPLEMAFLSFDETVKRHLLQVETSFKNIKEIPDVKTGRAKRRSIFKTPFERIR
jgi:hypothetical protein|tara:strand:+ start:3080 stop:3256 length:177 start_codon:yes stop_codon:yes gene_type:complete